jgi:hypothetical protein
LRYARDGYSVKAAIKKGRPLPDWYLDAPEQPLGCEPFYIAYRDLSTCRSDGPIPWTAVKLYIADKGLDPDVGGVLWDVIRLMDGAERRWQVDNIGSGGGGNVG